MFLLAVSLLTFVFWPIDLQCQWNTLELNLCMYFCVLHLTSSRGLMRSEAPGSKSHFTETEAPIFCDFHKVLSYTQTAKYSIFIFIFPNLDFKMENQYSLFCFWVHCLCPSEFLPYVCRYLIMLQTIWSINILAYVHFKFPLQKNKNIISRHRKFDHIVIVLSIWIISNKGLL